MTTTSTDDEPVPASTEAGAGSTHSGVPPTPQRDLLRALACTAMVAACVASPTSALVIAPFVSVLVALRVLRLRVGAWRFVALATFGSVVAAVAVTVTRIDELPAGVAAALLLTLGLGTVHARAARHDPIDAPLDLAWPEPRLRTGLTPTIGAWALATVLVIALAAPAVGPLAQVGGELTREAFGFYTRECREGGALASNVDYCERILVQRDQSIEFVRDHAHELLASVAAVFAFGSAATAHLLVLHRARRTSDRIRRNWRLRELELHWSAAYLAAAGLAGWMLTADGDGAWMLAARSVAVGIGALGALAIMTQGVGLAAWIGARRRMPWWYRLLLVLLAIFASPVVLTMLLGLGVFDLALHPRRRAAARDAGS